MTQIRRINTEKICANLFNQRHLRAIFANWIFKFWNH